MSKRKFIVDRDCEQLIPLDRIDRFMVEVAFVKGTDKAINRLVAFVGHEQIYLDFVETPGEAVPNIEDWLAEIPTVVI